MIFFFDDCQVTRSKDYVAQIVDKGTTFMKKAATARLAKL
jgi:hypothetical protein